MKFFKSLEGQHGYINKLHLLTFSVTSRRNCSKWNSHDFLLLVLFSPIFYYNLFKFFLILFCILASTDWCSGDVRLTCLLGDHTLKVLNWPHSSYSSCQCETIFQSVVTCFMLDMFCTDYRICFFWKIISFVLLIYFVDHFSERWVWVTLYKVRF